LVSLIFFDIFILLPIDLSVMMVVPVDSRQSISDNFCNSVLSPQPIGCDRNHTVFARIPTDRLADILDMAEDGIVTVDSQQTIILFNQGAAKLFGYETNEVAGQPLDILIPQASRESHRHQVQDFGRSPESSRPMAVRREVSGRRKDGSEFPAEVSISKFVANGELLYTAIIRDVTERRRYELAQRELEQLRLQSRVHEAEETVRETTRQLWQAARLAGVGELAASIAHELNNPLGIVALRVEQLLAKTAADDPRRKSLEVIEGEVERMSALVGNLLQFSRAGRDQVSSVDIPEELLKTLELVGHHLKKRRVVVEPDFAPNIPIIQADRQHLRQVFLNLFTNAADAMPEGGRLIPRVRPGTMNESKPSVVIEVIDTGVGIPKDLLHRVVEPFFTTKDEGKGTGLGLAICRRIIQQHHGTLEVESQVGQGTTVRITLPVRSDTNVAGLWAESSNEVDHVHSGAHRTHPGYR
jgi:PAS domain S-box-containing protein